MTNPAIFLDRDGVIIENRANYVREWSQVEFLKPALNALVWLAEKPYVIVIVTNQSAVGRGIISHSQADGINQQFVGEIKKAGGRVDAVYMCIHEPEADCLCRKPKPGLIHRAAQEMDLDLANSIMIGDALTDIQAGQRAGISQTALVLTGRGQSQLALAKPANLAPFQVYENLMAAIAAFTDHPAS